MRSTPILGKESNIININKRRLTGDNNNNDHKSCTSSKIFNESIHFYSELN